MKRVLAAIAMSGIASVVTAEQAHDHSAPAAKPPAAAEKGMGAMHGMHEHMKMMKEQMAQIRATTDPKERERLMAEHMKAMDESMSTMHGMTGCGKM